MTSLVPQAQTSALDGAVTDLATVLKGILSQKPTSTPERPAKAPEVVQVGKETIEAISRLNELLKTTKIPTDRTRLSVQEQKDLQALGSDAKLIDKTIKKTVESVKGAVFNHLDVGLEEDTSQEELAEYVDAKTGHYLVAGTQVVPDTGKKFVRRIAVGQPNVTAAGLKKLHEQGTISRATYYALTKKVEVPREVDEAALLSALKSNPGLGDKLASIIEPGSVVASFWIEPVGKDD